MSSRLLLLVDDDPQLAFIVRVLLRKDGHRLAVAPDAAGATRLLTEQVPDLVLLDINLPGTSGVQWLRNAPPTRPPVALFVQPALAADIAAAWDLGADYVLNKDLVTRPDAWKQRLGEILAHHDGRRPFLSLLSLSSFRGSRPAAWWSAVLERALPQASPVLIGAILRRALRAAYPGTDDPSWVVMVDGKASLTVPLPPKGGECLVDQAGCMLGTEAARAVALALSRS